MSTIRECEEYLLNIPKFKKKTLLKDTVRFYEVLGSPAKDIPKIHVAGTNGKGSTCFYISEILKAHGIKTGLFTSPHLVSVTERFKFGDEYITEEEFVAVFEKVKHTCELFDDEEKNLMHPSFFEFLFLMFMEWMQMKKADAIVLETGLGGMLDATNIFPDPKVCVIASVGIDHIEQLGNTLESIASQKAGIIKENVPVVAWDNGDTVNEVIKKEASKKHSKLLFIADSDISDLEYDEKHIAFSFNYDYDKVEFVHDLSVWLPTSALYQRINASLALTAARLFLEDRFDSTKALEALKAGNFKGRFEEVYPGFFVDGAHNPDALERLIEAVSESKERSVLIFGACSDKDYRNMLRRIEKSNLFDALILTKIDSYRATDPDTLRQCLTGKIPSVETESLAEAVEVSKKYKCRVYIIGSLYLVGEAIAYFDRIKGKDKL